MPSTLSRDPVALPQGRPSRLTCSPITDYGFEKKCCSCRSMECQLHSQVRNGGSPELCVFGPIVDCFSFHSSFSLLLPLWRIPATTFQPSNVPTAHRTPRGSAVGLQAARMSASF